MAKDQMLLDTNAYLRLAVKINPLLNTPFGPNGTRLYLIREFESEFKRSSRLKDEFFWVNEPDYVLNRRRSVSVPLKLRRKVEITKNALTEHVRAEGLGVSVVDCAALATGRALGCHVVTDDRDMRRLAHQFKISTMRALALLRQMESVGYIDMEQVRDITTYWMDNDDCPPDFVSDYRKYFRERHPRVPGRRKYR